MASHQSASNDRNRVLRDIPSVSAIVEQWRRMSTQPVDDRVLTATVQRVIAAARAEAEAGQPIAAGTILEQLEAELAALESSRLRPAINATGVLLHTNLGRAPVSDATARAMAETAASTVALEIDPDTGRRGGRMDEISRLMRAMTGAESTLVVNNNAAAVLLVLSALASGREIVVSRGQAVEIGGGFRIPDVLRQSGAAMIEVGTANRTYAADYARAITASTAGLLVVHTSNFRVEGFVNAPDIREVAQVANDARLPLIEDLGSGSLLRPQDFGLAAERTIGESIAAGVAVVTASGDKLLGGPQAGLICGRAALIRQIEAHPLARALRASKMVLAGVAETLRHYARGEAVAAIPVWRMIAARPDDLEQRAKSIRHRLQLGEPIATVVKTDATIGGGSLPGETLPSWGIALHLAHPDDFARMLRLGDPAVYGRINDGRLILDLRSVDPEDDVALGRVIDTALTSLKS
ncbi:MAG: L-seryl-tRNA(Sec) selenium transferase [Thermomicrobiales bacterium]|nr:L-seryl-tRNA(Sec) selenium transferase [Thermomicrobiales bacterium]